MTQQQTNQPIVAISCPTCRKMVPADSHWCGHCQARIKKQCAQCGLWSKEEHKICGRCGDVFGQELLSYEDILNQRTLDKLSVEANDLSNDKQYAEKRIQILKTHLEGLARKRSLCRVAILLGFAALGTITVSIFHNIIAAIVFLVFLWFFRHAVPGCSRAIGTLWTRTESQEKTINEEREWYQRESATLGRQLVLKEREMAKLGWEKEESDEDGAEDEDFCANRITFPVTFPSHPDSGPEFYSDPEEEFFKEEI